MISTSLHRNLVCLGLLLVLSAAAICANAEDQPTAFETITVTAERFPLKEKESSRFVTVVSAEELKETGANDLMDALKRIGGFGYKAYAPLGISHGGMNSELSIRGLAKGELVLINGVPIQGIAGHAYDLNTIPIDLIERVEILKGAASTLYGADAMTGVINIITKEPISETKFKGTVELGSKNYHNHSVSAYLPRTNIGLNYQHLGNMDEISRSFSKAYRYDLDATDEFSANININPIDHLYLDYLGSYYETGFQKHYDGNAKPYEGTDQKHYKNFLNLRYEAQNFKVKAFGTYDEMQRREYTSDKPEDKNKNYNYGLMGDYRFDLPWLELVTGADYVYRAADYNNQYGKHDRDDYSFFVQLKKEFFNRLILIAGAREQFIDGKSGAKDYDQFLPSFGATFKTTENLNLFANVGKAFRAPSFNNLYYESSFLVGNPDLGPEEGWTYETGLKYDTNMFRIRLSGFYMSYEDKIETDRSQSPLTYFNAGDYETKGIEWDVSVNPFIGQTGFVRDISVYTAGYWADPKAEDPDGEEYQPGPKFQTSLGLSYITEPLFLDMNCQILTSREKELDDYAVLNFYGKYKVWKGHLTFGVDNLLDEEVQVSGDLTEDSTNQYVYYDTGRQFKIGYEIAF